MKNYLSILVCGFLLCSCATLTQKHSQRIMVHTIPEGNASCTLTNNKGTWHIPQTPGAVTVKKSFGDLQIVCTKGNKVGTTTVRSNSSKSNVANFIGFGLVGYGVDAMTGAGYSYPNDIYVTLK